MGPGSEPLNCVLADCLVKYIDVLGRKGCSSTALEYCKLLLGLNPGDDPFGALLRIDYYAVRAKQYNFILNFMNNFGHHMDDTIPVVKVMPNFLMTGGIAAQRILKEEEYKNHNELLDKVIKDIN